MQFAVLVLLLAHSVHGSILGYRCGKGELHITGLSLHTAGGIEHLECARVAIRGGLGGNGGDLVVVGIHDLCAIRNTAGIRERYGHIIVVHPGLAPDSKYLLQVCLAVDGHGVGRRLVRCDGHPGREHIVVGRTPLINVLGSS